MGTYEKLSGSARAEWHRAFPVSDIALRQARQLFDQARHAAQWRIVRFILRGHGCTLLTSDALLEQTTPVPHFKPRIKHVALGQIVASEGRAHEFDLQFAPLCEHTRERWQEIAAAWLAGQPLPPVRLIQVDERYIVRDGHHRISVAYAVGATTIEAVIEQQFVTCPQ